MIRFRCVSVCVYVSTYMHSEFRFDMLHPQVLPYAFHLCTDILVILILHPVGLDATEGLRVCVCICVCVCVCANR